MNEDDIRKAAYARWQAEGEPEGQHERHWREAEEELTSGSDEHTSAPSRNHADDSISSPSADAGETSSEAIPARGNGQRGFKPGELASENK
ncbi:DUF2934 domain-containing protein [Rhizobium rhizogenes]|uniref:DUF2934 domain-containing protein n=1 Tax=Rhizobium rhizogenes TaxID=359 RepID=UPI0015749EE4|nr:DUF2934 domain-containing protein [Rhizobium rhizogenes]NTF44392.1 DUF2934 domain-containing protein [Rhizobium rhizogenes]